MNQFQTPTTKFPMQANLPQLDKRIIDYWEKYKIYDLISKKKTKTFELHFGPPFTNGDLHIGHGLNIILKDIVLRFKNLQGYSISNITGHDCHGLPVEVKVMRNKNPTSKQQFIEECKEESKKWIIQQRKTMKKMGFLMSDKYYTTMDSVPEIYSIFSDFVLQNKLIRAIKPMAWCTILKCVIADIDIEYREKISTSIYFILQIKNQDRSLVIWTTTPWTLLDNTAVAYNKNIKYSEVKYKDKKIIIATNLIPQFIERVGQITSQKSVDSKEFEKIQVQHPILEKYVPVVHGEHVTDLEGTGFVHTAPAHGLEDFELAKKYDLNIIDTVDDNGNYIAGTPLYEFSIKDEKKILDILAEKLLIKQEIKHSYPFCTRSNNPIIYKTTEQIFVDLSNQTKSSDDIQWYPSSLKEVFFNTIQKRNEWCISRNRTYGVPLALFINKKNNSILINKQLQEKILLQMDKDPTYFLEESCIQILEGIENPNEWRPYIGVLDVWFDSSCVSSIISKFYNNSGYRVADLYLEGKDQIRGWFQSSFLTSMISNGKAPYKSVVTHGFFMVSSPDKKKGEKMSKSLGNVIDLNQQIDKGNELFRIWVAKSNTRDDIIIGPDVLKEAENQYRKFRNVIRYIISIIESYPYKKTADFDVFEIAMLSKLKKTYEIYTLHMQSYEFNLAFNEIKGYIDYISNNYFNWRKKVLYSFTEKKAIVYAFSQILKGILLMLNPFIPFTTEEAFLYLKPFNIFKNKISIHKESFEFFDNIKIDPVEEQIDQINLELKKIRVIFDKMLQSGEVKKVNQIDVEIKLDNIYEIRNITSLIRDMLDCNSVTISVNDICTISTVQ